MPTHLEPGRGEASVRRKGGTPRALVVRRATGFAVAFLLTLILVFNGGGYDVVIRDQVGIAVWAAMALGLATGFMPRARLTPASVVALAGFGSLAALTLLSHVWTQSDEATSAELARVLQYSGLPALAYLSLNRYTWHGAALGFAAAALIVPFFALTARLYPDLITDQVTLFGNDRLSYPFGYWNAVSCWGAMAIAVGLTLGANSSRVAFRAIGLACVPAAALSVYLSYSRFGVAAVAIAVVAALALSRSRWTLLVNSLVAGTSSTLAILAARGSDEIAHATGGAGAEGVVAALVVAAGASAGTAAVTSRTGLDRARMGRRATRVAQGAAAVGTLLVAVAMHGPIGDAWEEFKNDRPPPASGGTDRFTSLGSARYDVWTAAVEAFESDPTRGIGPGTFETYWTRHGETAEFVRDAHSLYLEEAAELGMPGLIALVAGLGGLLGAALQARSGWGHGREIAAGSAMIASYAVFVAYAGIDWMWELGAIGTLAIGGVAVAGAGGLERASGWRLPIWARVGAVALALMASGAQVPSLVATERIRASDAALTAGDFTQAKQLADDAVNAEPWAASPYSARALALEAAGSRAAARRAAEDAIDRDPANWRHYLLLARIDAAGGDAQAVDRDLRKARQLAPRSPYLAPASPLCRELAALLAAGGR